MSVEARKWFESIECRDSKEWIVLNYLADKHNEERGYAWPSHGRIAFDTKLSVSSIKRAVNALVERGILRVARQIHQYSQSPATNRYYLLGHSPNPPKQGVTFVSNAWWNPDGRWEEWG